MNLEYRVLWFENDEGWFAATEPLLREEIEELGFIFNAIQASSGDNLDTLLSDPDVDLILMDFSLDSVHGDELIRRIRDRNIYTEVVFYSALPSADLGRRLLEQGVDGVYLSDREHFEDKVMNVVRITTRKVLDISTLRGLVMAEVSDHDSIMTDIIYQYHERQNEQGKTSICDDIRRRVEKSLRDKQRAFERIAGDDIHAIVASRDFDMDKKARTLSRIAKSDGNHGCSTDCVDLLQSYRAEILDQRNKLAHAREVCDVQGRKYLQGEDGDVFDDIYCQKVMKSLKEHGANLGALLLALSIPASD